MMLGDRAATVAVDFTFLLPLACTDRDAALDEVPITWHPEFACSPIAEHAIVQASPYET